jgi:hypothetical protein
MTEHPCLVAGRFHGLRRQCVGTVLVLGGGGDEGYAQSGFTCGMSHSILELSPLLCVNTCIGAVEPMHALAP